MQQPLFLLRNSPLFIAMLSMAMEAAAVPGNAPEPIDPQRDGWVSEAVSDAIQRQLDVLGTLLATDPTVDTDRLSPLTVGSVEVGLLRPTALSTVFQDETIEVRRGDVSDLQAQSNSQSGVDWLAASLRQFVAPLESTSHRRFKFKLVRIDLAPREANCTVYFQIMGRSDAVTVQQKATWDCRWVLADRAPPKLAEIQTRDYEEVVMPNGRDPWFADCTQAVLGHNRSFQEQLAYGFSHWTNRIERYASYDIYSRNGIAVGDVNGDGLDDIYVCQPGGLPNRLYVQNPDGTATDTSVAAEVDWLNDTRAALLVDVDNDGDQDLVLGTEFGIKLLQNDGAGKFRFVAELPNIDKDVQSISAADYDNDGDLDLYACVYYDDATLRGESTWAGSVYDERSVGGANRLFRNDMDRTAAKEWRFSDVTKDVGLEADNRRYSLAAAWEDYDNDGDQDLYIANDFGRNCLYRNEPVSRSAAKLGKGGDRQFENVAGQAGVVDYGPGMSVSWGDFNRDGRMDLYIGNMFSSAGSRITRQAQWAGQGRGTTRESFQRFNKGNSLYENVGNGKYREVSHSAAVEVARWAWSSLFADINNDGWEDLLVANGYITGEGTGDL